MYRIVLLVLAIVLINALSVVAQDNSSDSSATTADANRTAALTVFSTQVQAPLRAEILWDIFGTPHIYADNEADLTYGFGYAQMHNHADIILRMYAEARGRSAEYFGAEHAETDILVRTLGVPERAESWYALQNDVERARLDAFAEGMNAYAAAHSETIADELEIVLPVTSIDVLAHTNWAFNHKFVGALNFQLLGVYNNMPASNSWVITPERSASGNPLLMGNPHLSWDDPAQRFFEAQLTSPTYQFYGVTLVGMPSPGMGFNTHHGWTHTNNTIDGADLYAITPEGDGYRFDGEVLPFETEDQTLLLRAENGMLTEQRFTIRRTIHGPIIAEQDGELLAFRVVGLDRPQFLEQWWDMAKAQDFSTFEQVLRRQQMPMFNVTYADRDGNTMLLYNGLVPRRSGGEYFDYLGVVPGDTSETLWTDYLSFDELPRLVNPTTGFMGSSNEPPYYMTTPYAFDEIDFPSYLSDTMLAMQSFRMQESHRLLLADSAITFDELITYRYGTHSELAARILDDLIAAAQAADSEIAQQAAVVLAAWDRHYNADSVGASLFHLWYFGYVGQLEQARFMDALEMGEGVNGLVDAALNSRSSVFAQPFDPNAEPFTTPDGLAHPDAAVAALKGAAQQLLTSTGTLEVPWGEMARMRVGDVDLPAVGGSGELGVFRMLETHLDADGRLRVNHGDTFVFVAEFGDELRASVLMTYGNATQSGSPHFGDQLALYAENIMRPALLTREAVEAQLESTNRLQ
ncbi:MAG: penicillin acylase family protein [Anaerolineae bacterium]|nr:penicillin acylase family protein [Anaerolineae bacterium]